MSRSMSQSDSHKFLSWVIFSSRWLQAPLYLGLIVAQGLYVYLFLAELIHLTQKINQIGENDIMLIVLGLIDVVMVSNLLIMIIIGGYETFVSRLGLGTHPDLPEWLDHINASTMKIKLSTALVGISSIHLLRTFFNLEKMEEKAILWQVIIHTVFLLSSLALAYTAKVTTQATEEAH
jgi:uncharacterized protein (TIGR00645 family)